MYVNGFYGKFVFKYVCLKMLNNLSLEKVKNINLINLKLC